MKPFIIIIITITIQTIVTISKCEYIIVQSAMKWGPKKHSQPVQKSGGYVCVACSNAFALKFK